MVGGDARCRDRSLRASSTSPAPHDRRRHRSQFAIGAHPRDRLLERRRPRRARARVGVHRPRGDVPPGDRARRTDPHARLRPDPGDDAADERRAEPPRPPLLRRDGALREHGHEHLPIDRRRTQRLLRRGGPAGPTAGRQPAAWLHPAVELAPKRKRGPPPSIRRPGLRAHRVDGRGAQEPPAARQDLDRVPRAKASRCRGWSSSVASAGTSTS